VREAVLATMATALVLAPGIRASAATVDGCTLGSPNIVRDVTDCVYYLTEGCTLGSPNIIRDVMECLR
jgi:hypothetical protein